MFRNTRAEVLAQIEELRRTVEVLDYKIALYSGDNWVARPALLIAHDSKGN